MKEFPRCEKLIYIALLVSIASLVYTYISGRNGFLMIAVFALLLSFAVIYGCMLNLKLKIEKESERAKELQAKQILTIARASLPYLRQGLDISTAIKVAETILKNTKADAVALTDTKKVLGFKGIGADHHYPGQKIQTKATKEAISECKTKILLKKEEIGCPVKDCKLNAAIIVPLKKNDKCTATLKLYYTDPKSISQADIALAEELAHLLEIQLELSELARLEYLACEAELKALQSQINPHFFFNVLNTAVSYCRRNPKEAREILLNFSNFFRATIEHGEEPLITLDAEMALIKNYIELESSRFQDMLVFNDLLSESARRWKVPPFTIQPIVENAIQHAFIPGKMLLITVRDYSTPDLNIIEIEDNGAGIPEEILPTVLLRGKGQGMGVGLSLVHERLKLLYGSEYGLSIESKPGKGTKVRVILPSRTNVSLVNRLSTK